MASRAVARFSRVGLTKRALKKRNRDTGRTKLVATLSAGAVAGESQQRLVVAWKKVATNKEAAGKR